MDPGKVLGNLLLQQELLRKLEGRLSNIIEELRNLKEAVDKELLVVFYQESLRKNAKQLSWDGFDFSSPLDKASFDSFLKEKGLDETKIEIILRVAEDIYSVGAEL